MILRQRQLWSFPESSRLIPLKADAGLVWRGMDEDDEDVVILNKEEFDQLVEILRKDSTGKIVLEDHISTILVNSDITQFNLRGHTIL
jgi:hypothetical protein